MGVGEKGNCSLQGSMCTMYIVRGRGVGVNCIGGGGQEYIVGGRGGVGVHCEGEGSRSSF